MGVQDRRKILIAVDGSSQALLAVKYAASILDPLYFEIVLFHVLIRVPESFIDLEKMPAYHYRLVNVDAWENQQEQTIQEFMQAAGDVLRAAGFPDECITARVAERTVGIARDVAAEARNGYTAVIVGRKGLSDFKDFMLGSIAHKILELAPIPVWVVGGSGTPRKVLVCLDNSEGAMLAVKHVGAVLPSDGPEIVLLHVVRGAGGFKKLIQGVFTSEKDQAAISELEKGVKAAAELLEPSFEKATAELIAAGIPAGRISRKIVQGSGNSGNVIIEEAEKLNFDTIVVGRRGISRVEEFIMGRVSTKVTQLAKDRTVWIVS